MNPYSLSLSLFQVAELGEHMGEEICRTCEWVKMAATSTRSAI